MTRKILVQIPKNDVDLFFSKEAHKEILKLGEVIWNPHDRLFTEEELCQQIVSIHTVITSWRSTPLTEKVLDSASELKLIAHMAGSVKPILPSMKVYEQGIRVLNSNYAIAVSVSESVIALILALGHKIISIDKEMRTGAGWKSPEDHMESFELRGKTVGLVGLGMVAQEVIKLLQPFDVTIFGYDPFMTDAKAQELGVELKSLHDVLAESNIISLHAPKIPKTYHMIGRNELNIIRNGSILINTARGDLIDQDALIEELKKKRFSAGLDVFVKEPLTQDNEFRLLDNVIARPHVAGVNPDSRLRIGTMMINEMVRFYNGAEALRFEVRQEQLANMT